MNLRFSWKMPGGKKAMRAKGFTTLLVVCALWACANDIRTHSVGRLTKPESRVAVEAGGPHQAQWRTEDVAVIFDYHWEPDRFEVQGRVELQKRVANFPILDYLRVRIHFVDEEGVILATQHLWASQRRGNLHYNFVNFDFAKQYAPPPGTEMVAFSYTGAASDTGGDGFARSGGGGGRSDWTFWWRP